MLAVVDERGLPAVSLSTVAEQAGISPGRVQHYFPTKVDLVEAAFDRSNTRSTARITARAGGDLRTAPPQEVLMAILTDLIPADDETSAHMRVRQSFLALALHDDAIAARLRLAYAQLHHDDVADLLRRDQASGRARADIDTDANAVALVALAEGLAYYVLIGVTAPEDASNQISRAVTQLYR